MSGPDAWNPSHAECVEEVSRTYVEGGSQIILTNTFGASFIALHHHGLAAKAQEINRSGLAISRRAARERSRVFGFMGPTGKLLVSSGEVRKKEIATGLEVKE